MSKVTKSDTVGKGEIVDNRSLSGKTSETFVTKEDRIFHRDELLKVGDGRIGRDLFYMVTARYKIIYVRSYEEDRVLDALKHISLYGGIDLFRWDVARGLCEAHGGQQVSSAASEVHESPSAILNHIIDTSKSDHAKIKDKKVGRRGKIFVLLDFYPFLDPVQNLYPVHRKFKQFARISSVTTIVIISPVFMCPPSLEKEFTLCEFPLPSRDEIKVSLDKIVNEIPAEYPEAVQAARENEEEIINSVRGLTLVEAENAYAKSLVKSKSFHVPIILDEKKQIIRKSGVLEYRDPDITFDQIGGLDNLKEWLLLRRAAFSEDALEFGLPAPKGLLMLGVPGTGKSLTCSALADAYQMPLLRLDMGSVFGSFIGESETNIRDAIQTAEVIAPCVLWIDEIEKGIGGASSSNMTDGGVTARVFASLLTWMQEKKEPVFVVCTANNISGVPPEFLRAGRFDEIFFLDLPDPIQRYDVFAKLLCKKKRNPDDFDLDLLVDRTDNYSPAEIEKGIDNGLFIAYSDGRRQVTTDDIVSELSKFQPLYNGRREEVDAMRSAALGEGGTGGLARLANMYSDTVAKNSEARQINFNADEL